MITLIVFAIFTFIYFTNIGQIVHHTPDPRFLEKLGR